jgi:hypothetical protein
VQSLHLDCVGFKQPVDYTTEACKKLHTLFNRRNDLLHGNIAPLQNSHEHLFFDGTIPLFAEWKDFYDRIFGPNLRDLDLSDAEDEYATVLKFQEQVLSCLEAAVHAQVEQLLEKTELGFNPDTKRLGNLFPEHLVDFFLDAPTATGESAGGPALDWTI